MTTNADTTTGAHRVENVERPTAWVRTEPRTRHSGGTSVGGAIRADMWRHQAAATRADTEYASRRADLRRIGRA